MADLFKKKNAETPVDAPVAADANAPEAPEVKAKKEKKNKQQYLEQNQMNFLTQYEIVVEGKKQNLDLAKIMKPLVAVAVVVLAVFVILEVVLLGMKAQTKSLNKYINDEQNVASYNEALETKAEIELVNTQKANLETCMAAIDSYPNVGVDFFKAISNTATNNGITISDYTYDNLSGYLACSCTSNTTSGISQFVRDMTTLGLFEDVSYTGFAGQAESGYSFQIECVCKGDEDAVVPEVDESVETEETTEEVTEG